MNPSDKITPEIQERIGKLIEKYNLMGQDIVSYLDGLLYANYLTYWDYIHLDTLLSLQNPQTDFPDEMIFISYHQITEIYFKLILFEIDNLPKDPEIAPEVFLRVVDRVNRYFKHLIHSFDIMIDGMDVKQFLKFRMSLLPSSGFQSAQYRMIEISCTDFVNILHPDFQEKYKSGGSYREMFNYVYWSQGATELATGKKTLTLKQFEEKYSEELLRRAREFRYRNLQYIFENKIDKQSPLLPKIIEQLKVLDSLVNVDWKLAHYKSAVRYLQREQSSIEATGGTNWQKYLPPRFQRQIFYPELWTELEKAEWGKHWVMENVGNRGKA